MLESYSKFKLMAKMVRNACLPVSTPSEKCPTGLRDMMDLTFREFYHDFKMFRIEVNSPGLEKDEDDSMLEYNDSWLEIITNEYYDLIESSDSKLEILVWKVFPALSKLVMKEQLEAKVASEAELMTLLQDQQLDQKVSLTCNLIFTVDDDEHTVPEDTISVPRDTGQADIGHSDMTAGNGQDSISSDFRDLLASPANVTRKKPEL